MARTKKSKTSKKSDRILKFQGKQTTFDIFGSKWKLIICDAITEEDRKDEYFDYGITDGENRVIGVSVKNKKGNDLPSNEIEISILHELVHSILRTGQYINTNNDEPMVEFLARSLYSLIKQGII